jgi:hypothetical protein
MQATTDQWNRIKPIIVGLKPIRPIATMKLKDSDISALFEMFEEALNRAQHLDKPQRIQLRKKIRNELFSLLNWELITPAAIMSRWENRFSDVFSALPMGFKEEVAHVLAEKLRSPLMGKRSTDSRDAL